MKSVNIESWISIFLHHQQLYLVSSWRNCWIRTPRRSLPKASWDCRLCRWGSTVRSCGGTEAEIQNLNCGRGSERRTFRAGVDLSSSPVGAVALHRGHVGQTLSRDVTFTGTRAAWRTSQTCYILNKLKKQKITVPTMSLARSACRSPVCIYLDFYRNLQPQQQMSGSHSCLEVEPLQVICFLGPSFGSPHCKNNGMDKK